MKGFILIVGDHKSDHHLHHMQKSHDYHIESGNLMSIPSSAMHEHKRWDSYGKSPEGLMQVVAIEFAALQAAKNNEDHRAIMMKLDDLSMACEHAKKNM